MRHNLPGWGVGDSHKTSLLGSHSSEWPNLKILATLGSMLCINRSNRPGWATLPVGPKISFNWVK